MTSPKHEQPVDEQATAKALDQEVRTAVRKSLDPKLEPKERIYWHGYLDGLLAAIRIGDGLELEGPND